MTIISCLIWGLYHLVATAMTTTGLLVLTCFTWALIQRGFDRMTDMAARQTTENRRDT